ncbi:MAG TPA: transcription-repair coupling factor, partial [Saliniramus sp.]|nr:transcription-repair coupling factor [Saliniramus sp.]
MSKNLAKALNLLKTGASVTLSNVPDGFDAIVLADLVRGLGAEAETPVVLVHVARDGQRAQAFERAVNFAMPTIEVMPFPAWDCQPYDRVSPTSATSAQRMTTLARLARTRSSAERPRILSTTVNAILQRIPPRKRILAETFSTAPGNVITMKTIVEWLEINGFLRTGTVHETGEYAIRGGILDLYAPGLPAPVRLDFFGDTLET